MEAWRAKLRAGMGKFEASMANRVRGGWKDGRIDGHLEIPPFVLQDIGPSGPLPKKRQRKINKDAVLRGKVATGLSVFKC